MRKTVIDKIGGLDEDFFMYLEDADICRRLTMNNCKVSYTDKTSVQHDARRNSLKSLDHFRWHFSSLIKFLLRGFSDKLKSGIGGRFKL
jgi:GT2 family glycosyltransferase